jgi:hypothetical protein
MNATIITYKTIILPVVLYMCGIWYLTLREECRLTKFENRVLRIIFGLKRDEVTGDWRKLRNEELHELYTSSNIMKLVKLKKNEIGEACNMNERDE